MKKLNLLLLASLSSSSLVFAMDAETKKALTQVGVAAAGAFIASKLSRPTLTDEQIAKAKRAGADELANEAQKLDQLREDLLGKFPDIETKDTPRSERIRSYLGVEKKD